MEIFSEKGEGNDLRLFQVYFYQAAGNIPGNSIEEVGLLWRDLREFPPINLINF